MALALDPSLQVTLTRAVPVLVVVTFSTRHDAELSLTDTPAETPDSHRAEQDAPAGATVNTSLIAPGPSRDAPSRPPTATAVNTASALRQR